MSNNIIKEALSYSMWADFFNELELSKYILFCFL